MKLKPTLITSRQNELCKVVRSLHSRKGRRQHRLFLVEGDNAVSAALRTGLAIEHLLGTPEALEEHSAWVEQVREAEGWIYQMDSELLAYVSEAETSPGIIALANLPVDEPLKETALPDELLLLLDGVGDPGNVGTLLRSADAAGAAGFALTQGSADLYSPKTIRSSAGSLFNLPVLPAASTEEWIAATAGQNVPLVIAVAHEGEDCFQYNWPRRCALVLGHETKGISPEIEAAASARVTIPVYGGAESLNVAAAGAVLLYAWRQAQLG